MESVFLKPLVLPIGPYLVSSISASHGMILTALDFPIFFFFGGGRVWLKASITAGVEED